MQPTEAPPPLLGEHLIASGVLSRDQLRIALHEQRTRREPLGRLLTGFGFIDDASLNAALARQHGAAPVDLDQCNPDPALRELIPAPLARRLHVLPLHADPARGHLTVAIANGLPDGGNQLRAQLPAGWEIEQQIAGEQAVDRAIERFYGADDRLDQQVAALEHSLHGPTRGATAIDLLDALLADAVRRNASDIHFEPEAGFLRIRYRIDGRLRQMRITHAGCWPPLCIRLKVLAGLDIAETRSAQDGRFSQRFGGRAIDFRVACLPTLHGENLVLRILDRTRGIVPLPALGLADANTQALDRLLARPDGLLLVTGPTGSGKTTTLYALLDHLNDESVNIMTLEDPVEYPLQQLRQTSLGEAAKLDFASGVRALLRQDPDILLIGEIRDAETARMALRAALTGHRVFATLHANSALGALPRLRDMDVGPGMLSGNLSGIIAQRLIRRLCPACSHPEAPDAATASLFAETPEGIPATVQVPGACPACDFQGYRGRLAIMEVLVIDPAIDALIGDHAPLAELRRTLIATGFHSLLADGLQRIRQGETTIAELARAIDLGQAMARPA